MKVPFVDLKAQYLALKDELDAAVLKAMSETAFISGRYAAEFEASFANYIGAGHCVAVANGTDALEIGLRSIGIESGDEVLVPANTFLATAEAVTNIGAQVVFVDNDPTSYNIDPSKLQEKITAKTRAIIPVHLYGLPAEMDEIMAIAKKHSLKVLEDCAQAHGATYKGQKVGTFGNAATFSFYPSKNLGAFGDAGAIVTNDSEAAARARLIANHGQISKNRHTIVGRNSRMDGIQASVLSVKLPHLDTWLEARKEHARLYDRLLADAGIGLPAAPDHVRHTYHLYVVRVEKRDAAQAELANAGIETGIHYPTAVPFMEAYARPGAAPGDFPVSHAQMGQLLSLPMYAELTDGMIDHVCEHLKAAVSRSMEVRAAQEY
ncbi:MAG TPA: DegT/DnrJ/EryC1/StrS family aminotransferase [Pyrinomonadaceae bacterium]|nr:DegT/DnrJ/EryC1/StrS family aminotransferase [Pyrinomonadaceae bacterium]